MARSRTPARAVVGAAALLLLVGAAGIVWGLMLRTPGKSFKGTPPPLDSDGQRLAAQLRDDVQHLAGVIGERNLRRPDELQRSADWIEAQLERVGYTVQRQTFQVQGQACHNLELALPGQEHSDDVVVLGAHYDTVPGSPGANDNGSGVASLLALARRLRAHPLPARALRLVWFVNEEAPYFGSEAMGSLRYARRAHERGERVVAMLSLETMGYYSQLPGSQRYPWPLQAVYPDTGNFIALVANVRSRRLLWQVVKAFRQRATLPSEAGALPAGLPGVGWSDHWAFWQQGYPALMVTDTAPFRYPHYHGAADTPDKLDYERLARVTLALEGVVDALAQ